MVKFIYVGFRFSIKLSGILLLNSYVQNVKQLIHRNSCVLKYWNKSE